jgi:predicted TIM-barrel fold metal-dependent hydrolase
MSNSALIDSHTHTFIPGLPLAANARYAPDYDASFERLIELADRHGIGRMVIVQSSFLGHDNTYLLGALRAKPDQLRGVPWIDPRTTTRQWDEMNQLGVVGLRFPIFGLPTPNWGDYREAFAEAKHRGWHLHLYVESHRLPEILPVFLASGANVVVPHLGMFNPNLGPHRDPGFKLLLEASKTDQIHVLLSGPYRTSFDTARDAVPMLLDALGPDHLIWGSDWPHTNTDRDRLLTYPLVLDLLKEWVPDKNDRQKILIDTPKRLFHFS